LIDAADHLWGNPSSVHGQGQKARAALDRARRQVAHALGARPGEIVLTSGATEANALAWRGLLTPAPGEPAKRALWTAVEHPSLKAVAQALARQGLQIEEIAVDAFGRVDLQRLSDQLERGPVALASVQWVNQELGCVQPLAEVARLVHAKGALLHCDATQGWGRLPLDVKAMSVDLLSVSGGKIGAPAGTGALWLRPGVRLQPVQAGHQEQGLRGGTENLLALVALGAAAEALPLRLSQAAQVRQMRDRLWEALQIGCRDRELGPMTRNADLPADLESGHILSASWPGLEAPRLIMALDLAGVAASAGSACSSGTQQPSHVLAAIRDESADGLAIRRGTVRFSLGPELTDRDIDTAAERILATLGRLRKRPPTPPDTSGPAGTRSV
jgi:cysteine desulfurase